MKTIILAILILSLSACSRTVAIDDNAIILELEDPIVMHVDSVFEDISIIQLDTSNLEGLVSSMCQIRVYKNRIFVYDVRGRSKIVVFDSLGNYINVINNYGKSANEVLSITSMELDRIRDRLYVVDGYSKKCLVYDLDGNFQKSIKYDHQVEYVGILKSGDVVHTGYAMSTSDGINFDNDRILVSDSLGGKKYSGLKIENAPAKPFGLFELYPNCDDSEIMYLPLFSDAIYSVNDSVCVKYRFKFNLSKYKFITSEAIQKSEQENLTNQLDKYRFLYPNGVLSESQNYLYVAFGDLWSLKHMFYSKRTGKIKFFDKLIGDNSALLDLIRCADEGDRFYGNSPLQYCIETSKEPLSENFKQFFEKYSPDENNLYVVSFKLKDF